MSITQFLRILWARRFFIVATTVACVIGAYIVTLVLPARWEGHARVMLNLLKPDPVTGEVIAGPAQRAYIATQTSLISDYTVVGQLPDEFGMLSDPKQIAAYEARPKNDLRDFRHWLSDKFTPGIKAQVIQGSNILEITFAGGNPEQARSVAEAIRKAYLDTSLNFRRDEANRSAAWFDAQAVKNKAALDAAQAAETNFEKANGIVMADDKTDLETARLRALSGQGVAGPSAPAQTSSAASIQLAEIDAQIAQEAQTLGPNHPELVRLRAQRASIASLVTKDIAAERAASSAAASGGAAALDRAVEAQKARVIAQGDKLQQLTQLQADVALRRDQLDKTSQRAAELHQEAAAADTGLTPMGPAVTPQNPVFPNMLLIIPGSFVLGLAVGVLVALLSELFARRVRSLEDLEHAVDLPLLAVIAGPPKPKRRRLTRNRGARPVSALGGKVAGV
jgi:uncharacterized protein involved in exopolysaccharide biosynthesis